MEENLTEGLTDIAAKDGRSVLQAMEGQCRKRRKAGAASNGRQVSQTIEGCCCSQARVWPGISREGISGIFLGCLMGDNYKIARISCYTISLASEYVNPVKV